MCEIDAWPGGAASCGRLVCACSALVVERKAQGVVIEPGLVPLARRLLSLPRFLLRASLLLRLPAVSLIGPSAYGDISRYFESSQGRFQALFLGVKVKHRLSVGGALHVAAHDVVEKGVMQFIRVLSDFAAAIQWYLISTLVSMMAVISDLLSMISIDLSVSRN